VVLEEASEGLQKGGENKPPGVFIGGVAAPKRIEIMGERPFYGGGGRATIVGARREGIFVGHTRGTHRGGVYNKGEE